MGEAARLSGLRRCSFKKPRVSMILPANLVWFTAFSRKIWNRYLRSIGQTADFQRVFTASSYFRSCSTSLKNKSLIHNGASSVVKSTLLLREGRRHLLQTCRSRSVLRHFPEKSGIDSRFFWKEIGLHSTPEIPTCSFQKIGTSKLCWHRPCHISRVRKFTAD